MTHKVVLAGAYGMRSMGDDAAAVVLVAGLRKVYPDLQVAVVCRHAAEDLYAGYGLRSLQGFEYDSKAESLDKWFRGFNYPDDRSTLLSLQKEIEDSDLLVLGAGNALVDYTIGLLRGPIPYFAILTLMAKMVGTAVMWFGISVGPLWTEYGRNLTRLAAQLADIITVRDERSVLELRELGFRGDVIVLPDPVLGLEAKRGNAVPHPVKQQAHQRGGPVIAVSVRQLPGDPELSASGYLGAISGACDRLVRDQDASLLFVPHCTYTHGSPFEDDRNVAAEVVRRMTHRHAAFTVADHLTVEETTALYSGADAALCTRLHGNVSAALEGVSPVALSYNPKVANFMKWLDRGDQVIEPADFSADRILTKLELVLEQPPQAMAAMEERVAGGRRQVERYCNLAVAAIEGASG